MWWWCWCGGGAGGVVVVVVADVDEPRIISAPEFLLMGGRPPKPLTDLAATVDAAKLAGESLIQRPK